MAKLRKIVIGAPRTGEKDEAEVRWLISYSDFMMQLVCLFILLYSVSSLDKGRMARVAAAYRASVGIGEVVAFEGRSSGDRLSVGDRSLIGGALGGGDLKPGLRCHVEPVPGGFRISFEGFLFSPGSSELDASAEEAVDSAARVLKAYAGQAKVTTSGDGAASADALSLAIARAQSVVGRLERSGLDPRFITAAGRPEGKRQGTVIEVRTE